jgi:hypothetical protein
MAKIFIRDNQDRMGKMPGPLFGKNKWGHDISSDTLAPFFQAFFSILF